MAQLLWSSWAALQRQIESADHLLLFLDYDGTLTSIVDHPSRAFLPAQVKRLLQQLVRCPHVWVAIISGRTLSDLKKIVGLKGLFYIGNHGLELESPLFRYTNSAAQASRPFLQQISKRLQVVLKPIHGAWVEDKEFTLSVHYRNVSADDALMVKNSFYGVLQPFLEKHQVHVMTGKQVFEVRPHVRWTKGTIVNWLIALCLAETDKTNVLPLYIGDDETDEDAFEALGSLGRTVVVGPSTPLTQARYYVENPEEVHRLLRLILESRRVQHGKSCVGACA